VWTATKSLGSHQNTVRRWRDRFAKSGVAGVGAVAPGRDRKPQIPRLWRLHTVPKDGSAAWTTQSMASRCGGKDTVIRIWRARGLRPWCIETFKLSNDLDFETKCSGPLWDKAEEVKAEIAQIARVQPGRRNSTTTATKSIASLPQTHRQRPHPPGSGNNSHPKPLTAPSSSSGLARVASRASQPGRRSQEAAGKAAALPFTPTNPA